MTKPKRKKKRKSPSPLEEFRNIKGSKREQLIAARKVKRLTQGQLAKRAGCSTAMISHLENGRLNPNADISIQLEQVLEIPFYELFPDL